jgi:hypothetical protein
MIYDSILYGNGLTIKILNTLKNMPSNNDVISFIDIDRFISNIIDFPDKRISRDFLKPIRKLHINGQKRTIKLDSKKSRAILRYPYIFKELNELGFERFMSKHLFMQDEIYEQRNFLYPLYNYWYYQLDKNVLHKADNYATIFDYAKQIKSLAASFYTTNFDLLLDDFLTPQHLHGKFVLPYPENSIDQLIAYCYHDGNTDRFYWNYLYGTNGWEKINWITELHKRKCANYDLDFFFSNDINFGHMLIYGVAFGKAEFMSDELHKFSNNRHQNSFWVNSVDGHILLRLVDLQEQNRLSGITISYYNEDDLKNYRNLFSAAGLDPYIEFKSCSEILL